MPMIHRPTTDEQNGEEARRVLIVTQFFPPEPLGGSHRWQQLAESMPDRYDCHVICPPPSFPFGEFDRSRALWERMDHDGTCVTRLWTYQPRRRETTLGRVLNYGIFAVFASIYVLLFGRRYDCVVTVSAPHTTFLAGVVARGIGVPWVVDVYDRWLENAVDLGYTDVGSVGYRFVAWLERVAFRHADSILTNTPTMAEAYQQKYCIEDARLVVVPFGVDRTLFDFQPGNSEVDRVIYTGNLGADKAFEPFLRGFASLDGETELLIVGDGDQRNRLEQLSKDLGIDHRVTFSGVLPRRKIPKLLAESKLSLVPLKTEFAMDYARPTKLVESMAVGTPYVASCVQEITTLTRESEAGFAVENDPDAVAAAIETCLEDDERTAEMGVRGSAFVTTNHRWDHLAEKTATALEEAIT